MSRIDALIAEHRLDPCVLAAIAATTPCLKGTPGGCGAPLPCAVCRSKAFMAALAAGGSDASESVKADHGLVEPEGQNTEPLGSSQDTAAVTGGIGTAAVASGVTP